MEYVAFVIAMIVVAIGFGVMGAMVFTKRRLYVYRTDRTIVWLDPHGIQVVRRNK